MRSTCVHPSPRARVLETKRYASPAFRCGAPSFELCPYFVYGGLGMHEYCTGTPPSTLRMHARGVLRKTPCFVGGHTRTTRNPAAKTCEPGQRSRHPKSKARDLFQSGLRPRTSTAHGCVITAVGHRGCRLHLEPVPMYV